jgi:2-iminobutanoate/2-iminopropanoate deaminase
MPPMNVNFCGDFSGGDGFFDRMNLTLQSGIPWKSNCIQTYVFYGRRGLDRAALFSSRGEHGRLEGMSDHNKTAISTKEAPAAIGPYSQAVRVGDMLFASGQVGLDPATGQLVGGGITEQTTRVLENVKAVLAKAGLDMAHVVKTTVFLKTMDDFAAMNAVYAKYLAPEGVVAPARSTVAVAGLPKDALVEIEVIAKDAAGV